MDIEKEEEKILRGEKGEAERVALELLIKIGELNKAKKLIKIKSSHVSGVSYKTIGEHGLSFLRDFADRGARACIKTTLNPAGVEIGRGRKAISFPCSFADKQREILKAYKKMGIELTCTCTPYLANNLPKFNEHLAWAESSAVIYANSVIGAKSNRESAITALASSLIGKIPLYGLHLSENREPKLKIVLKTELKNQSDYSALAYYISKNFTEIPFFVNIKPNKDELKAMSAALGIGSINMFHVKGITPEAKEYENKKMEVVEIGKEELKKAYEELNTCEESDFLCTGCPHASMDEIKKVCKLANKKKKKKIYIFTSKKVKQKAKSMIKIPENVKIIAGTCMVVAPLREAGIESMATNSAKCAFYSLNLSKIDVKFASMREIISS